MNKKENIISASLIKRFGGAFFTVIAAFTLTGCSTQKSVVTAPPAQEQTTTTPVQTYEVKSHPEVISIAECIDLLGNHDLANTISKKYSYKQVIGYNIYRLENYEAVLYKNCRLPKKMNKTDYEDTPLPLAKGTSSYVTIGNNIQLAVFNNKAYQNLIEQIKGLGFTLVEEGYENRYSNGTTDIYTYEPRKLLRIEKTL